MEKLFGLRQLEEARSRLFAVQTITSCNLSVDYGTAKYVIFSKANEKHRTVEQQKLLYSC
jgi:hypothetical protein